MGVRKRGGSVKKKRALLQEEGRQKEQPRSKNMRPTHTTEILPYSVYYVAAHHPPTPPCRACPPSFLPCLTASPQQQHHPPITFIKDQIQTDKAVETYIDLGDRAIALPVPAHKELAARGGHASVCGEGMVVVGRERVEREEEIRGGQGGKESMRATRTQHLPGLHELGKVLTAGRAEAHGAEGKGVCCEWGARWGEQGRA